jgi:hypothetical protein
MDDWNNGRAHPGEYILFKYDFSNYVSILSTFWLILCPLQPHLIMFNLAPVKSPKQIHKIWTQNTMLVEIIWVLMCHGLYKPIPFKSQHMKITTQKRIISFSCPTLSWIVECPCPTLRWDRMCPHPTSCWVRGAPAPNSMLGQDACEPNPMLGQGRVRA